MSDVSSDRWNEWELLECSSCWTSDYLADRSIRAAELQLSPWELAILESIWYGFGQVDSKELLADRAFGTFLSMNPEKLASAVEKCFREDWVQFVTAEFLHEMQQEIKDGGYLTPTGLIAADEDSMVGLISFTRAGASLYLRWLDFHPNDPNANHRAIEPHADGWATVYGTSMEECDYVLTDSSIVVIEHDSPIAIGRWCDRWWSRFESGYRVRYRYKQDCDRE